MTARLILFTGAGGAGVTTFAAGTALLGAGRRPTRLIGWDDGALGDALGPAQDYPPGLSVVPIEADAALGADAADVLGWVRALLGWAGVDQALMEELALLPLARLLAALTLAGEDGGVTVVDCGSAAEALPLLHLLATEPASVAEPEGLGRIAARVAGPLVARLVDMPAPSAVVRGAGKRAAGRLERLRNVLRDTAVTSVRLVLPADPRAQRVLREAGSVCGLHGIGLDAAIMRGDRGRAHGTQFCLVAPWREQRARGPAPLRDLAEGAYAGRDPLAVLAEPRSPRVEMTDAGADLVVPLPERPAAEFRVSRSGRRLSVSAGPWRRVLTLPAAAQAMTGRRAWHDGEVLRVRFEY